MEKVTILDALIENYEERKIISIDQLTEDDYYRWLGREASLYAAGQELYKQLNWKMLQDGKTEDTNPVINDIYEILRGIQMDIGQVSGEYIHQNSSLPALIVGYVNDSPTVLNRHRENPYDMFRERLENYLAREIIIQRLKGERILQEELDDTRLIRRTNGKRIKAFERQINQGRDKRKKREKPNTPKEKFTQIHEIVFYSILVIGERTHSDDTTRRQEAETVIDVIRPDGSILKQKIKADYYPDENIFMIPQHVYEGIRSHGVLICQAISQSNYEKDPESAGDISEWKPESLLHRSGYNVSAENNLTEQQRHEILKRIILNNLYSKKELISFLGWLISRNRNMKSRDMSAAIAKWESDKKFIENWNA